MHPRSAQLHLPFASRAWRLALVLLCSGCAAPARNHVNMETYIFRDDDIGRQMAQLLVQRRQAGVIVNLIYDAVGSMDTPREFFEQLAGQGLNVLEFNPVDPTRVRGDWALAHRDHRKLLIVDGSVVIPGGPSGIGAGQPRALARASAGQPAQGARCRAGRCLVVSARLPAQRPLSHAAGASAPGPSPAVRTRNSGSLWASQKPRSPESKVVRSASILRSLTGLHPVAIGGGLVKYPG